MTAFLVSCPDCGCRFPVERETMRATTDQTTTVVTDVTVSYPSEVFGDWLSPEDDHWDAA